MSLFMLQPMAFGAWLALIPYIKEALALSKAELAVALLGMPVALIPTLQLASRIVGRFGPRRAFIYMLPVQTVVVFLPFAATSVPTLFAALACLGATVAFLEVALNTYAGRLEKAARLIIMSRCHGFWAMGVALGSFLVASLFALGPVVAVGLVCLVSAGLGVWAAWNLPKLAGQDDGQRPKPQKLREMPRALFLIAGFALLVSLLEGAMADWAAVYLSERWGGGAEDAGIAVTVFASFLAAGRFAGDWMNRRLGPRGVARLTAGLALVGVLFLTVPDGVAFVFIGYALAGLGVSIAFPLGVSAAAALDDEHEAQNIATMAMVAMTAFLFGPPLIGFVAEAFSLRIAFMALIPGLMLAFWLSRVFSGRDSHAESPESESLAG